MNRYLVGATVTLEAELRRGSDDALTDASGVVLKVQAPGAPSGTPTAIVVTGLGRVTATVVPTTPGIWRYRFESAGGVEEGAFEATAGQVG